MNNKKIKKLLSAAILIAVGFLLVYAGVKSQHNTGSATPISPTYRVKNVLDGDTAQIEINGQTKTVRFIGIDTPETVDPRKPVQCFGREASQRAHELLDNQIVGLENDIEVGEQDKYGRLLRYIILSNGEIYNKKMISEGYAHEYTYQNQNYRYQSEFKQAESQARSLGVGLWNSNTCQGNTTQPAKN